MIVMSVCVRVDVIVSLARTIMFISFIYFSFRAIAGRLGFLVRKLNI